MGWAGRANLRAALALAAASGGSDAMPRLERDRQHRALVIDPRIASHSLAILRRPCRLYKDGPTPARSLPAGPEPLAASSTYI